MKNEFLTRLHQLKLALEVGELSPEDYKVQRQAILDAYEPTEEELEASAAAASEGDEPTTLAEHLETEDTVTDIIEHHDADRSQESSTVELLFDHTQSGISTDRESSMDSEQPSMGSSGGTTPCGARMRLSQSARSSR